MTDMALGNKNQNIVYKYKLILDKKISQSPFLRNIFIIGGGNLFAQMIGIILSPIITRLYFPSDFGVLAVFNSILSVILVTAALRYELAIPIQKEEKDAANLLSICILLLIANSIVLSFILYLGGDKINTYFDLNSIKPYFPLLILGFFGSGLYNIFLYWAIRQRDYYRITYTKINQTVSGSISKILVGLFHFGPLGLIIGTLISQIAGVNTFIRQMLKKDRFIFSMITYEDMKSMAKQNSSFPIFSLPSSIINSIALALPVIMLSTNYGLEETGLYSFAYGILVSPGSFISTSISQVYYGEVANHIREKSNESLDLFYSTTRKLGLIGIFFIGIPAIFAPSLFPIIFGNAWKDAGSYCLPLSLMVYAAFVVSTTSRLGLLGFNHWQLIWDISRTLLVICGFLIAFYMNLSAIDSILIYSLIMTLLYVILYIMNIYAIKINIRKNRK